MEKSTAHRKNFWLVTGAQDTLKNSSVATLAVWIKPSKDSRYPQDLISVSVGGTNELQTSSRAALRLDRGGRLYGIGRSEDNEAAQSAQTEAVLVEGRWQHVTLVIDYQNNKMLFYHDGVLIPSKGRVRFKSRKTANTPSRFVAIGSEDDGLSRHFDGELKHAGIWNRKFTEDDIKILIEQFSNQFKL